MRIVATDEWTTRNTAKGLGEKIVKDIKRATHRHYSSEEKTRIVLDGPRGETALLSWTCRAFVLPPVLIYTKNRFERLPMVGSCSHGAKPLLQNTL